MPQPVPPPTVALLRRRYLENVPTAAIKAETGITSTGTFYACLDGRYDDGSGAPLPLPRIARHHRWSMAPRGEGKGRRTSLVTRIWRNAEAQVEQIEARLARTGLPSDEFERDARSLAVVVRTLRELAAFDAARRGKAKQQQKPPHEQPIPRNIDDLRRELARKLAAIADEIPRRRPGAADAHGEAE